MLPAFAFVVALCAIVAAVDGAWAEAFWLAVAAVVLAVPWPTSDGRPRRARRRWWDG